jgi:DnaK suppressor protein
LTGPIDPTDDDLRRALRLERERVIARLVAFERTFDEMVERADLEPADDEHDPDGTTAYERAQVTSLAGEARARLVAIDQALDSDDDLTTCTACRRPIGTERLQAIPGTRVCVHCAARGAR